MANPFCHVELHSDDPEASKKFYSGLFDWEYEEMPMGDMKYTMIKTGEKTIGGIMKNQAPSGTPSHWLSYILVDDVSDTTKKAEDLGADILQDVIPVPGNGKFSIVKDPTGAVIAFWQPDKKN